MPITAAAIRPKMTTAKLGINLRLRVRSRNSHKRFDIGPNHARKTRNKPHGRESGQAAGGHSGNSDILGDDVQLHISFSKPALDTT
jgi:hypothetical protein